MNRVHITGSLALIVTMASLAHAATPNVRAAMGAGDIVPMARLLDDTPRACRAGKIQAPLHLRVGARSRRPHQLAA